MNVFVFQELTTNYQMIFVLADVCKDLPALANILLRIFRQEKKEIPLIRTIVSKEIEFEGMYNLFMTCNISLSTEVLWHLVVSVAI